MQAVQFRERLVDKAGFELAETLEVLHRGWHIDGMRCVPTTAWWPTPASSPTPACSRRTDIGSRV
jgi:hypothetical protein